MLKNLGYGICVIIAFYVCFIFEPYPFFGVKSVFKSNMWKNNNFQLIQVLLKFFNDSFQACLCLLSSHV